MLRLVDYALSYDDRIGRRVIVATAGSGMDTHFPTTIKGIVRCGRNRENPPNEYSPEQDHEYGRSSNQQPAAVFVTWSGGKARLKMIQTQGRAKGGTCGPFGAHGYFRKDGEAVNSIISFIRSR